MASYSNRWVPKSRSKPPKRTLGHARAIFGLALAGLGIWTACKLARKSPGSPNLPQTPPSGVLPFGTSG